MRVITAFISVFASPFVLAISLFRPSLRVGKRWIASATVLLIICAGLAFAASSTVDYWSARALRILSDYARTRLEVRDLPFAERINFEALRNGLDPCLVAAVISQESGFQVDAVSWRGARGLMQIMPATWREFMPEARCKGDHAPPACSDECIFDPTANLRVGTSYLRYLVDLHDGDIIVALASYNAGLSAVAKYNGTGSPYNIPPFPETQGYTRNVVQFWAKLRGEIGEARIRLVETARTGRAVLSWVTVSLAGLLFAWVAVRYDR
jgi:soluble lytic murein transglycosylase-like protein